jgi:hypothetical protein
MNLVKKFVIGRYYFNSLFKQEAEGSFISDLMKEPFIEEKSFEYAIGNLQTEVIDGHELLRGTFGRMRNGTIAKTYDKDKKEFKQEILLDIADAMLEFIINHENHLIFIEYSSLIKPTYFAGKFKKIYANTVSISDFEIDYIFIEQDVYEAIKKWKLVDKVSFKKLRPSNPSSLDDFKEIEDLLKETKSERTNIEFQSPNDKHQQSNSSTGLNYESKLIKQGLALSAHGYGEAKLKGIEGDRDVEVESKKFLKKVEIDFSEDGALKKVIQTIKEINRQEKNE